MRPHVAALYAFARVADDIADEGTAEPAARQAQLRAWQGRLHEAAAGPAVMPAPAGREDLIFSALGHSIRSLNLPVRLFDDLLSAFCQDTTTNRYASWPDVLDYCRRSANPVGRLVLRMGGYGNDALDRSSDALCTALQLTNFWQDLAIDWSRGRLYVPREVWWRAGADPADLDRRTITPAWRAALAECSAVTERFFGTGRPVCDVPGGRLRYELRATWLGGMRIIEKLRRAEFDVFRKRPRLTRADALVIALEALTWRATPRSITRS
jgi:squalene synthase HpnC